MQAEINWMQFTEVISKKNNNKKKWEQKNWRVYKIFYVASQIFISLDSSWERNHNWSIKTPFWSSLCHGSSTEQPETEEQGFIWKLTEK